MSLPMFSVLYWLLDLFVAALFLTGHYSRQVRVLIELTFQKTLGTAIAAITRAAASFAVVSSQPQSHDLHTRRDRHEVVVPSRSYGDNHLPARKPQSATVEHKIVPQNISTTETTHGHPFTVA